MQRILGALAPFLFLACAPLHTNVPATPNDSKAEAGVAPPPELAPNAFRDRRAEPGVRAASKPLAKKGDTKCGKLKLDPGPRLDLLGGRFSVAAPANAKLVGAPDGTPVEHESRIVLEEKGEGLAIGAQETFMLDPDMYEAEGAASPKLDAEAAKFLTATFKGEEGMTVEPVEIPGGIRAYAARPREPNAPPGKDTALVLALLVAHPDGLLETVTFHVRGERVRNATGPALVGCQRAAEKIAASMTKGTRTVDRAPGARTALGLSSEQALTLRVPPDYVVVPMNGSARVYKLRPLGSFAGSITVLVKDKVDEPKDVGATTTGKLLGRETTWRGKTSDAGGFYVASAPLESHAKFAEVLVRSNRSPRVLDEFRGVAETLSIEKAQKP